jgi:hypothetical protein
VGSEVGSGAVPGVNSGVGCDPPADRAVGSAITRGNRAVHVED